MNRKQRRFIEKQMANTNTQTPMSEAQAPDYSSLGKRANAFYGNLRPKGRALFWLSLPILVPLTFVYGAFSLLELKTFWSLAQGMFWVASKRV